MDGSPGGLKYRAAYGLTILYAGVPAVITSADIYGDVVQGCEWRLHLQIYMEI